MNFIEYILLNIDKFYAVILLIASTIGFRFLLEALGQRWITTYAHTATLTFLPVITFVITKVITGNIALSLGMVGALSIVRFRHPVRSPFELSVYFGAITMGIAASVSLKWLIFLIVAILLAAGSLAMVSLVSRHIFKREFFNASFSEGNLLSTLDLTTSRVIGSIDKSKYLKSKGFENDTIKYLLVSNDSNELKKILSNVESDSYLISYQLNT